MKTKVLSLLSGTFVLLLITAPMIPTFTKVALADPAHHGKREGQFSKLNLTADQKAKIQEIQDSTRQQIDAVFTPEQKAQLQTNNEQQHQRINLNLSDDQKDQIKKIREDSKAQINAVLTPEQQQQLEQMHSKHHQQQ